MVKQFLRSPESRLKTSIALNAFYANGSKGGMYGKKHLFETKDKISKSNKGKIHNPMSEETKIKIGNSHRGVKLSKEHKKEIGRSLKGRKFTIKWLKNLSESHKGQNVWNKGKIGLYHHSKESRKKMSDSLKGKKFTVSHKNNLSGKNNGSWQGGISFEPYGLEFNKQLKESIRKRDGYKCMECKYTQEQLGYRLPVHHIDYNKRNNNPSNLVSLCRPCHAQTNFSRNDWKQYFNNLKK